MVEQGKLAFKNAPVETYDMTWEDMAETVIDAILPQVSTVAELEALPFGVKVLDAHGDVWWAESEPHRWWSGSAERGWPSVDVVDAGPLTVVWMPEESS